MFVMRMSRESKCRGSSHLQESTSQELLVAVREVLAAEHFGLEVLVLDHVELHVAKDLVLVEDLVLVLGCQWHQGLH